MNIFAIIFWLFIAIKIGNAIGKSTGNEINVQSFKSYERKRKAIEQKYLPYGYNGSGMMPWNEGYIECVKETNELNKRYGIPEQDVKNAEK